LISANRVSHALRGAAAGLIALGVAGSLAPAQELNAKIEGIIAGAKLGSARVGCSIIDLESGRTLADIQDEAGFIPASNMKLLTSGTALVVLGEQFIFRTELVLDGDRLIIRGAGDPALADPTILERMQPKMTVDGLVASLAAAVAKGGASRISEVIVDDRVFDREMVHPTWPQNQLDRWYCAPVSGLNFHTNVLSVFPSPAAEGPGRSPTFALEPSAPWLEIENKARTTATGKNAVWLTRDPAADRFTLFGEVRYATRVPVDITLHDPARLFGQLVAAALPAAGVSVAGVGPANRLSTEQRQRVVGALRLAGPEEKFSGRTVAAVTTHIRDILERCNGDSQNLYAESLIKRIGHEVTGEPGSWSSGASVIRMTISQDPDLGPRYAASTVIVDGSGMSRDNRVAPRTLTRWLRRLEHEPYGELFVESLATPGDGTLRRRFGDARLHTTLRAKSGKVDGVRCLSGYVTDPATRRRVAFSVMVNDLREGEQALNALQLHEEVVRAIDAWMVARRPSREAAVPDSRSVTRPRR
jgi:D-alanyl-D-alanine carboxypeptidase/D-alanyl-D-alanine-endopeptidase (penicillin-binding protein 4)